LYTPCNLVPNRPKHTHLVPVKKVKTFAAVWQFPLKGQ
jgi:hypothetical protein